MKPPLKSLFVLAAVALAALCSLAAVQKVTRGWNLTETNDLVHLQINQGPLQSYNAVEIWRGGTLELAIPGTNAPAQLKLNLGIQAGTQVVLGTSTNVAFGTNFSAVPTVTMSVDRVLPTNQVISAVTVSNFTITAAGTTGTSNKTSWIAIGSP